MSIITEIVKIRVNPSNYLYLKDKGYIIPTYVNKRGREVIDRNSLIDVKVEDLYDHCNTPVTVSCDCCNEIFNRPYSYYSASIKKYNGKNYCPKCIYKLFKSGSNHPLWREDLTDEERIKRRRFDKNYDAFTKNVLERDDYTCFCCKKRGGLLDVHHLDGYNWCKEKRTVVSNGITLCRDCHTIFHRIYGNKNNTSNQFWEWMNMIPKLLEDYNGTFENSRKVFCYEENKVYSNVLEYCQLKNIKDNSKIYAVCNHKPNRYTAYGFHFFWYDEYLVMSDEKKAEYLAKGHRK